MPPAGRDGLDLESLSEGASGRRTRIPTYVEGLDALLDGGVPKGHVVLVAGAAGSMKSSVTFTCLFNNAKQRKLRALYVSLEQNRTSLLDHMEGLGLDISDIEETFNIWDLGLIRSSLLEGPSWLEAFKKDVEEFKDRVGLDLLVIDSLPVLDIICKWQDPRTEVFHLFEWFRELGITTFLISEMSVDTRAYSRHDEDFLSDGIITLQMVEVDEVQVQRRLRVVKMRATNHSMNHFNLLFEAGRFKLTKIISKAL